MPRALDSLVTLCLFLVADKFTTLRLSIFVCKMGLMVIASPSLVIEMVQYSEMPASGIQYVEMASVHAVASQIPPDSEHPWDGRGDPGISIAHEWPSPPRSLGRENLSTVPSITVMQGRPAAENANSVPCVLCDLVTLGTYCLGCVHEHNTEKRAGSPSTLRKGPEREGK